MPVNKPISGPVKNGLNKWLGLLTGTVYICTQDQGKWAYFIIRNAGRRHGENP